eukprot:s83_g2.t1
MTAPMTMPMPKGGHPNAHLMPQPNMTPVVHTGQAMPGPMTMPAPPGPPQPPEIDVQFWNTLRHRKAEFPADIQQEITKREGKRVTKDLFTAVQQMSDAREEYEKALLGRAQHLQAWKAFLAKAVNDWQTFAQQFVQHENHLQERISFTRDIFVKAKEDVDQARQEAGEVVDLTEEETPLTTAASGSTVDKVTASIQNLTSSLQQLHSDAAALEAEVPPVAKRPRIEVKEPPDEAKDAKEDEAMGLPSRPAHKGRHVGFDATDAVGCGLMPWHAQFQLDLLRHGLKSNASTEPVSFSSATPLSICSDTNTTTLNPFHGHSDADPLSFKAVCISGLPNLFQSQQSSDFLPQQPVTPSLDQGPPSISMRVPSHTQVDDVVREYAENAPVDPGPPDEPGGPPPIPVLPNFARQILEGDQQPIGEDWTIGITIRTWFLHFPNHQSCVQPRLMQLVGNALSWRQQLIALWLDRIVQIDFLDVYLANPNPPRPSTLGHVAYDVLVVQNMQNFKSGLVTAMSSHEPWEYWTIAAFFPVALSGLQLVQTAHLEGVCQQHGCMLFYGWTEIPLTAQPTHQMEEGHSFTVRLRSHASAASSSRGIERVLPEQEAIEAPPVVVVPGDDATDSPTASSVDHLLDEHDMPPDQDADASPGYSPSADADQPEVHTFRSVSVYGLNVDPVQVQIPWSTPLQVLNDLAGRLQIPLEQLHTVHSIIVRVAGQQPNEESVILQRIHDIPAGSMDQLILMDLEIHQHPGHQMLPAYPQVLRKVCQIVQHVTRSHLLMHAGVFHYCGHINVLDRCLVHINDQLWPLQDIRAKQVISGTYVRVVVPPPIWQVDGTMQTIERVERQHRHDLPPGVHPYQRPAQVPQEPMAQQLMNPPDTIQHSTHRRAPDPIFNTVHPSTDPPGSASRRIGPRTGEDWYLPVGMQFLTNADFSVGEDMHRLEWVTWYLRLATHPRCEETRTLELDVEQEFWYQDLYELWRDRIVPNEHLEVLVVDPDPPRAPEQRHIGHLLLVQGAYTDSVPSLITAIYFSALGRRLSHHASFVPRFTSNADIVRILRLERICLDRGCYAFIGGHAQDDDGLGEVQAGENVLFHVPPRTSDATALLQQAPVSHRVSPVSNHYEDDPAERRLTYVREYQRHLPTEEAAIPLILGFEQEVLRRWPQFAHAGPGGLEHQVTIRTWYNDHHRWPICDVPRDVGLFEDINLWRPALLHTWRDRIDPTVPVEFFLVAPDPTDEVDLIVAHLIVLQRPMEDAKSVLVTVFDDAIWNNYPRRWALRASVDPTGLEIVALMGYRFLCPPQTTDAACHVWCQGQLIDMHERFLTHHGLSLDLRVVRQDIPEDAAACERLTDSAVAHACRPQDPESISRCLSLEQTLFAEPIETSDFVPLYLIDGAMQPNAPDHLLLPDPVTESDAERDLAQLGLPRHVYLLGSTGFAFCLPVAWHLSLPGDVVYAFHPLQSCARQDIIIHQTSALMQEVDLMKLLYSFGFQRAVIVRTLHPRHGLYLIEYHNNEPALEQFSADARTPTPWPLPMPSIVAKPFFDASQVSSLIPEHVLTFGVDFQCLSSFFESSKGVLCPWHSHLDMPELIRSRLPIHDPLEGFDHDLRSFDRFIVYTDGSSKSANRRNPPLWVQEYDVPDTWAFLVLGERYAHDGAPPEIVFLGWHAQSVTYETDLSHFLGTDKIGSEFAEREALFWSALWRLSVNLTTPTIFRSDSVTSADQSTGRAGSCDMHPTFCHLRSIMQALQAALPPDCFAVEHVRGHAGDVWNEMVDFLAKHEATVGHKLTHQKVNLAQFSQLLPYLWMLFDSSASLPRWTETGFDVCPPQLPASEIADPMAKTSSPSMRHATFTLSIVSLNVGSLFVGPQGFGGKVSYLRHQMQALGLNVLGLQEARSPAGMSTAENVLRLSSGCDKGHHGVELWVNLLQPIGHHGQQSIHVNKQHFQVLHADPRRLLVRLAHDRLDCFFLVLHGPQSGRSFTERQLWWQDTQVIVNQLCRAFPLYVLVDANAKTGPCLEPLVYSKDDVSSANTPFLVQFLRDNALCLPCTTDLHQGHTDTWTAIDGMSTHRIDYVAVPQTSLPHCTMSVVLDTLDTGNAVADHQAVVLELKWTDSSPSHVRPRPPSQKFNREAIRVQHDHIDLSHLRSSAWDVDIESQVRSFNDSILGSLHQSCPQHRTAKKKPHISDEIWHLRTVKLQLGRRLHQARRNQNWDALRLCFVSWSTYRAHRSGLSTETLSQHFAHAASITCSMFALNCQYWSISKSLKRGLQQCKNRQLLQDLQATTDKTSAGDLLHLLKTYIGPSNPKKQKRSGLPAVKKQDGSLCATPAEATARWTEFFSHMEGGISLTPVQYRQRWLTNLARFRDTGPFSLPLSEVPSLVELEAAYRRVAIGKAIGEDSIPPEICRYKAVDLARLTYPMLLKVFLFGQEAIEHKGGRLAVAWKHRGDVRDCKTHRSLLVSSHIGKTLHRALRQRHHGLYTTFMQTQQLGGRPKMPVGIPLHLSRAFLRWQKRLHRPTALVFLDLAEAFYRVVRPFALGGFLSDEDIATISARLGFGPDTLHHFYEQLQSPSALQQAGASPVVQRFLQALHSDTWFRIGPTGDTVRTMLGSRPGDSYADVVFGLLWAKLLRQYEEILIRHDVLEVIPVCEFPDLFGPSRTGLPTTPFLGPTWMDDLNVCLAAESNSALVRKTGFALSLLLDMCSDMHMEPNLAKGKTEVMFTFRGSGARDFRRKFFSTDHSLPVVGEHGTFSVSVVSRYLHLGGLLHHRSVDRVEVTRRLAIAHQAFTTHRRLLYHNTRIPWAKRREIFCSLVLSKLLYGLESWTLQIQQVKDQFYGGVMRLYKRLLRVPHDSHLTDLELLSHAELPLPDELLRTCRLRYFGTLHNCGSSAQWGLLQEDTDWIELLKNDLRWLWGQLHHTTTLGDPQQHFPAWRDLMVFHGGYWKKLIKRGVAHAISQRQNHLVALSLHRQCGEILRAHGWVSALPNCDQMIDPLISFGCMQCRTRHLSHAGECVHMCRRHQQITPVRRLFDGTNCPACLKEFHTRTKVLAHLRSAHRCRQTLIGQRCHCPVMPGVGSSSDRQLQDQTDGALPFLQGEGPLRPAAQLRDFDAHSVTLFEALYLRLLDLSPGADIQAALREEICTQAVSWTVCQRTLRHFEQVFTQDDAQPLEVPYDEVVTCVRELAEVSSWPFLLSPCRRPVHVLFGELAVWESWCAELADTPPDLWLTLHRLPRSLSREKVILHAYAGRRRRGDLEWYIDRVAASTPSVLIHVVSVDIIIDADLGDITKESTRIYWLDHIRQGHIVGFVAGPPCNTWSKARNHQLESGRGPRVVRTPSEPWGLPSLSLRELAQVRIGTLLLGFALQCMLALSMHSGTGFLEHPRAPDSPELGLFGSASAKPTTLLVLGMQTLEKTLHAHRVTVELPSSISVGRASDGSFRTAPLKEYPPSMCKAIALSMCEDFISMDCDESTLPTDFMDRCKAMSNPFFGSFIGHD